MESERSITRDLKDKYKSIFPSEPEQQLNFWLEVLNDKEHKFRKTFTGNFYSSFINQQRYILKMVLKINSEIYVKSVQEK